MFTYLFIYERNSKSISNLSYLPQEQDTLLTACSIDIHKPTFQNNTQGDFGL
jgi:hypothetical protein